MKKMLKNKNLTDFLQFYLRYWIRTCIILVKSQCLSFSWAFRRNGFHLSLQSYVKMHFHEVKFPIKVIDLLLFHAINEALSESLEPFSRYPPPQTLKRKQLIQLHFQFYQKLIALRFKGVLIKKSSWFSIYKAKIEGIL